MSCALGSNAESTPHREPRVFWVSSEAADDGHRRRIASCSITAGAHAPLALKARPRAVKANVRRKLMYRAHGD